MKFRIVKDGTNHYWVEKFITEEMTTDGNKWAANNWIACRTVWVGIPHSLEQAENDLKALIKQYQEECKAKEITIIKEVEV